MAYLVIHTTHAPPERIELRGPIVVGRAVGCEVWMDDLKLSRKHCRIEPREDDRWVLVDLNSSNGSYVRGKRVSETILVDEDEIEVGNVTIVFYAGRFVSTRPADPIAELSSRQPEPEQQQQAAQNSTVVSAKLFPQPMPRENPGTVEPRKEPAVPLAFTRPPPTPIVREEVSE